MGCIKGGLVLTLADVQPFRTCAFALSEAQRSCSDAWFSLVMQRMKFQRSHLHMSKDTDGPDGATKAACGSGASCSTVATLKLAPGQFTPTKQKKTEDFDKSSSSPCDKMRFRGRRP